MKERLDVLLVKRNLAESREKAKAIMDKGLAFTETEFPKLLEIILCKEVPNESN